MTKKDSSQTSITQVVQVTREAKTFIGKEAMNQDISRTLQLIQLSKGNKLLVMCKNENRGKHSYFPSGQTQQHQIVILWLVCLPISDPKTVSIIQMTDSMYGYNLNG